MPIMDVFWDEKSGQKPLTGKFKKQKSPDKGASFKSCTFFASAT